MKLARMGIIAAAILSIATVAHAQRPDFSGSWTVDPAAAPAPPAGGGGGGRMGGGRGMMGPIVVKQTADTLTIERTMGAGKVTTTYKLDGTESVNKLRRGRGENATEVEVTATAKFDGSKLTIVEKSPGREGGIQEVTQVWALDGGNLVIETTSARGTQKRVYKKTT